MDVNQYFDEAFSLFKSLKNYHTDKLALASRTIHLHTPSLKLRDLFIASIAHLNADVNDATPELTIWYAESRHLNRKLMAPPQTGFNAQGFNVTIDQEDFQIFYQSWQKQVFLYSRSKRTGIYWTESIEDVPWWEVTFSFRAIFHFWTRDLPAQLVHAGGIALNGSSAVLITGPSGSGKSTSCLNLLLAGHKYLGDDYVWVEYSPIPVMHALYQTAKIEPDNLATRFLEWTPFIKNPDSYKQQKAIFDIKETWPDHWLASATIKAILLPFVHDKKESAFDPIHSQKALMAMAPTTLHHLPHHRKVSYQKLKNISSALPAYTWQLGYNKGQFQTSFTNFLHGLS